MEKYNSHEFPFIPICTYCINPYDTVIRHVVISLLGSLYAFALLGCNAVSQRGYTMLNSRQGKCNTHNTHTHIAL